MKDEGRSMNRREEMRTPSPDFSSFIFSPCLLRDCREYRQQLRAFTTEGIKSVLGNDGGIDKEIQPVEGLIELLQAPPDCCGKLRSRSGPARLTVVRSHR